MNAGGNVRFSVMILGEYDLTHQTARAIIERINPVTRAHASALAPRKDNQGVELMPICRAQCRDIGFAGFVRINEVGTARLHKLAGCASKAMMAESTCQFESCRLIFSLHLNRHVDALKAQMKI